MTTFLGDNIRSSPVARFWPRRRFFFSMQFAEAEYQDILSGFKGSPDDFQQDLYDLRGLFPEIAVSPLDRFDDIDFYQCVRHVTILSVGANSK